MSPRSGSAPSPLMIAVEASERARPTTWWPAASSSATTAEPIPPLAPVTNTRTTNSFE